MCALTTAWALAGHRSRSEEPPPEEPQPAQKSRTPIQGVPMPTMGGTQLWADELFFHRWRIQGNVLTGHYRLLDGNNLRHAWGTYEHCRAKLDEIRQKAKLPPMTGKAVVLLHELSLFEHFSNFPKGVIDISDVVYYMSLIGFFIFLTHCSLETRKWRGSA